MMASTTRFIQDPSFPQDGLPEGALPDHLPFLGRVDDHVHADARPQDIGDDIPESLGKVDALRTSPGTQLPEGPDDAAEHGVTPGVLLPHRLPSSGFGQPERPDKEMDGDVNRVNP
jgi:hypothetical protein